MMSPQNNELGPSLIFIDMGPCGAAVLQTVGFEISPSIIDKRVKSLCAIFNILIVLCEVD